MQLQQGSCAHLVVDLQVGRADQELGVRRGIVLDRGEDVLDGAADDAAAWRSSRRVLCLRPLAAMGLHSVQACGDSSASLIPASARVFLILNECVRTYLRQSAPLPW